MELGPAAAGDSSRVKLLCSFGGTILPRPLDGRLRYVGGETRIVTFPRRFSYKNLLTRARDLFDGTSIIKYQQPDEELDALVSVVNDEDVVNMMEEYEKLSAVGNGVAWLRIFLFSPALDHDLALATAHFNADERENERRYIDALNCLADASLSPPNISENYLGANFNLQNLHRLTIPHHSHSQMYDEVDASCRSAFFSPGRHAANDAVEFPSSPSSAICQHEAGEFGVRFMDDYVRQAPGYQLHHHDRLSSPCVENLAWIPTGTAVQEISGFPTNLEHSNTMTEGNNICDHHLMAFRRSHSAISGTYLKHGLPHLDHPNMADECVEIFQNSSAECFSGRDLSMVNQDMKIQHGTYANIQKEQHNPLGAEHERDWAVHNHQSPYYQTVRTNEHYIVDGAVVNCQFVRGNANGGHLLHSNCIRHDDTQYLQHGAKFGNDIFLPQQTVGDCNGAQAMRFEAAEAQYPNQCSPHGAESVYQSPTIFHPNQYLWRSRQATTHPGTFYEPSTFMMRNGGTDTNFLASMHEVSNTLQYVPVEDQIPNALLSQNSSMQQRVVDFQEHVTSDFRYLHGIRQNPDIPCQPRSSYVPCSPGQMHVKVSSETVAVVSVSHATEVQMVSDPTFAVNFASETNMIADMQQRKHGLLDKPNKPIILSPEISASISPEVGISMESATNGLQLSEAEGNKPVNIDENGVLGHEVVFEDNSTFLPESIAFEKKAVLKDTDGIAKAHLSSGVDVSPIPGKKEPSHKCGPEHVHTDVQVGSAEKDQKEKFGKTELMITEAEGPTTQFENSSAEIQADAEGTSEHEKLAKIEPTTAEAEALAKGLQTIRNDDLEDIRELGSGTFGSVYHGKWKGSDVAIKRIKASCFTGRPAERERLIADFWKEALMLSGLHHPNVVSFYGVVRDGLECSLATVTEFMVNGSLKKFLQKKDRTIDRRKRLIIAMDVAFGMVYLHAKDIVHFDLKCENLLVNMRDPHRPICKIGDLGLSKVKQHSLVSGGLRGTLPWMAPELLSGKSNKVSEKIDVYSFGIVMWELLTGEDPYADMQCASIIGGIVNNTIRPKIPTWCDPEWKSLMESCWSLDPTSRPSFSEISHKLQKMAAAINLK